MTERFNFVLLTSAFTFQKLVIFQQKAIKLQSYNIVTPHLSAKKAI